MRISEIIQEDNVELDQIEDIIINTWRRVYPNVNVKIQEDDGIYVFVPSDDRDNQIDYDDDYESDEVELSGFGDADFKLNFSVYEPDGEDPDFSVIVTWAYSGEYKGYIGKLFAELFKWGKRKYPNATQNLVVQMDRNPEAWGNMAEKLGVNYLSESSK